MREIDLIVIHYSATREDHCFAEYDLDICYRRRGFNGPGYHFYIRKDGRIVSTRPVERVGAHARRFNARSTGICYEDGLNREGYPEDAHTPEQKHSTRVLMHTLLAGYPGCEVCGYHDLSTDLDDSGEIEPKEWIKACPCFEVSLREVFG